ncbi:hypothetical protein BOW53_13680 [Solemya pervernicosa gill symbiont]|uniref:DUF2269 domain-containing protein n=1 Tax=Solemya pervernicosa gill symbiont TaxID=642797 RepID=A0A1T2L1Q6_9GAMM|nr:DUF2269 domain-containing protein [Solemya pervernicosa gill symbiont]OOZ38950.1 hypothetical protein BOW53_13680 [Solemya pervernicosa gill symbiont]
MTYAVLKSLHILSMVLLFGTGLGSAFYKWMADRGGNVIHIANTNRHVVLADWIFTMPTVIFQPISGLWLIYPLGLPLLTPWIVASLFLFVLAGTCWLPVVWLQIKMKRISEEAVSSRSSLPEQYWKMARWWFWLGVPAFASMVLVVVLMVFKQIPGAGV